MTSSPADQPAPSLPVILREWGRIGCVGFGGPPTHIRMLRDLCVSRRGWLDATEFEDALAACNLLPGPASTQLAIFCAWRLRGRAGALVGGAAFILPGLALILVLAAVFLAGTPPLWVRGAGAGAGAAVAAVAVQAGCGLIPASWARAREARAGWARAGWARAGWARARGDRAGWARAGWARARGDRAQRAWWASRARWAGYLAAGGVAAATVGPWLVLVLLGCGVIELTAQRGLARREAAGGPAGPDEPAGPVPPAGPAVSPAGPAVPPAGPAVPPAGPAGPPDTAGSRPGAAAVAPVLGAPVLAAKALAAKALAAKVLAAAVLGGGVTLSVAWVALKVGALSYGGGFVIIPLMQGDAVGRYHWLTGGQFLNAVALGQITPGPVVQTVSAVGYAAAGLGGGLLAAVVAFAPSFAFVLAGAPRFGRLRGDARAGAFLAGAGPAAIGAILGSAVPLALALSQAWQYAVLAAAAVLLLLLRRGVVLTLLLCGVAGVVIALAGAPVG
jgi:chromate transporter